MLPLFTYRALRALKQGRPSGLQRRTEVLRHEGWFRATIAGSAPRRHRWLAHAIFGTRAALYLHAGPSHDGPGRCQE